MFRESLLYQIRLVMSIYMKLWCLRRRKVFGGPSARILAIVTLASMTNEHMSNSVFYYLLTNLASRRCLL